jgi:hypothetical protein
VVRRTLCARGPWFLTLEESERLPPTPLQMITRCRYKKIYEDFRPDFVYWKLVLLGRKLCLAFIVVLVNKNILAQV